jgi:hypothetical protein
VGPSPGIVGDTNGSEKFRRTKTCCFPPKELTVLLQSPFICRIEWMSLSSPVAQCPWLLQRKQLMCPPLTPEDMLHKWLTVDNWAPHLQQKAFVLTRGKAQTLLAYCLL